MIVVCFVLMLIVGRLNAGAAWLGNFFLAMGVIIAAAFLYSLRNAGRRLKEMREENRRADKITKNCLTNPVPRAYDRGDAECASPLIKFIHRR